MVRHSERSPTPSPKTSTHSTSICPGKALSTRSCRIPMTAKVQVSGRWERQPLHGDTNLMFENVTTNRLIPTGTQSRTGIEATTTTISLPPTSGRMIPSLGKGSDTKNRDSSGPQRPGDQLWHPSQPVRFLGLLTMHGWHINNMAPAHRAIALSFFNGIGTAFIALENLCGRPALAMAWEIDPDCLEVTKTRFPYMVHRGDFIQDSPMSVAEIPILEPGSAQVVKKMRQIGDIPRLRAEVNQEVEVMVEERSEYTQHSGFTGGNHTYELCTNWKATDPLRFQFSLNCYDHVGTHHWRPPLWFWLCWSPTPWTWLATQAGWGPLSSHQNANFCRFEQTVCLPETQETVCRPALATYAWRTTTRERAWTSSRTIRSTRWLAVSDSGSSQSTIATSTQWNHIPIGLLCSRPIGQDSTMWGPEEEFPQPDHLRDSDPYSSQHWHIHWCDQELGTTTAGPRGVVSRLRQCVPSVPSEDQCYSYTILFTDAGPTLWRHGALAFGATSSVWVFNRAADCLMYLARKLHIANVFHYVDDYAGIECSDFRSSAPW